MILITVGAVSLALIALVSLYGIYSPKVDDGLIGRFLHVWTILTCIAAVPHLQNNAMPRVIAITIIATCAMQISRSLLMEAYGDTINKWLNCRKKKC